MKKNRLAWLACTVLALASGMSSIATAQDYNQPPPPVIYSQEELDQMLAPVALYPDALLAQVLMAATYPLEVVQAARFVDSRPGLQGDGLARAVSPMPWDPSVKSLVQFPSVLAMMNDKLDWTQQLGNAFLSQQANVMDTVQNLRMRAQMAGHLQSNGQQRILQQERVIVIESVNPQVIYVPYYNPTVIYGGWWWPDRPPVYWVPPPRYRPPQYSVGIGVGIFFGAGVGIIHSVFNDARPDWRQHQVLINNVRINNVTNNVTNNIGNNSGNNRPTVWQHNNRYPQRGADPRIGNGPGQGPNRGQGRPEAPPSAQAPGPRPNGGPARDHEDRGNRPQPTPGNPGPAPQARPAGPAPQLPPNAQGPERNQRNNDAGAAEARANAANEQRMNQQRQNEQRQNEQRQNEQRANGQRQQEQRQQQEQQHRQQQDMQRQQHQQEAQARAAVRPPEAPRAPEPRPQQAQQPQPRPQPAEHARPERAEPQGGGERRERDR
ncbi:DUF3300 domain-containing protein [Herbaspirillum autotrophicum]|uniref:DUF3300 domain-containing protein n=1 Tax=Herbaspirillum autotrophicum TaxID=180195 RepID=UPI00067B984B|nr:DUF3300 domain-containing protein [Herbaspirillum autotrophicum]